MFSLFHHSCPTSNEPSGNHEHCFEISHAWKKYQKNAGSYRYGKRERRRWSHGVSHRGNSTDLEINTFQTKIFTSPCWKKRFIIEHFLGQLHAIEKKQKKWPKRQSKTSANEIPAFQFSSSNQVCGTFQTMLKGFQRILTGGQAGMNIEQNSGVA